MWNENRPLLSG